MSFGSVSALISGSGLRPYETASVFAGDIIRRVGNTEPVPEVRAVAPRATPLAGKADAVQASRAADLSVRAEKIAEKAAQGQKLESALADVVTHMTDTFGATAGTAMMGLMYKRIGDGPVTEQSLGQGLLDAVRFVDTHFGIQEGDGLISYLNGDVNDSLNAFFDNGSNEKFFATTTALPEHMASMQIRLSKTEEGEEAVDVIKVLLESYQTARDRNGLQKPPRRPGFGEFYEGLTAFTPQQGMVVDTAV